MSKNIRYTQKISSDDQIKSDAALQRFEKQFDRKAQKYGVSVECDPNYSGDSIHGHDYTFDVSLVGTAENIADFMRSDEYKRWSGWDDATIEDDISKLEAKDSSDPIESARSDRWYFGQEAAEKYGDLIVENLSGKKISKRSDLAEEPGGLIYEANQLGIDMWDLLEALEGLCYQGRAREIDDSTYLVLADVDSCWNAVYSAEEVCEDYAEFVGGPYDGQWIAYEDILELPEFNGYNTNRSQRPELWNWPKIKGYTTAMWDGDHVRYESWDVYDALSQ